MTHESMLPSEIVEGSGGRTLVLPDTMRRCSMICRRSRSGSLLTMRLSSSSPLSLELVRPLRCHLPGRCRLRHVS